MKIILTKKKEEKKSEVNFKFHCTLLSKKETDNVMSQQVKVWRSGVIEMAHSHNLLDYKFVKEIKPNVL